MNEVATRGMGDNSGIPATDQEVLRQALTDGNASLSERQQQLLDALTRVPEAIPDGDEELASRFSDFIKQMSAFEKLCETTRVGAKEPYLQAERAVDGFFKKLAEPVTKAKKTLNDRLTGFLRRKEQLERERREAEAARLRAEALRQQEEARRKLEAATAPIQPAPSPAPEQGAPAPLSNGITGSLPAPSAPAPTIEQAVTAQRVAETAVADAAQADKAASASAADLSRTRGDFGGVSSLQTFWDFKDLNRDNLDLTQLRAHIPLAGLEQAVRAYIKANKEALDRDEAQIAGVTIYKNTKARTA